MKIHEYLEVRDGSIRCVRCDHELGPADRNYKLGALRIDRDVTESNPHVDDPSRYVDADVALRQYVCPGCGQLLDNEVARTDDPPVWDIRVDPR